MLNMQEHLLRPDYLSVETKKNTQSKPKKQTK